MGTRNQTIPVIDLFAGPGGLSEGFSRYGERRWASVLSESVATGQAAPPSPDVRFDVKLSIEKDAEAHKTLHLRAFFRTFGGKAPAAYYRMLRGEMTREQLFAAHPEAKAHADAEAWHAELGDQPTATPREEIDRRIKAALGTSAKDGNWVLIGGPPCQAYSLVGRARNKGNEDYVPEEDHRHFLYREYLRIVAKHKPRVFVMENVRGILSAKVGGQKIFDQIQDDLRQPGRAVKSGNVEYDLFSFVPDTGLFPNPADFVIRMEQFGIPQTRHRVIILGIRKQPAQPIVFEHSRLLARKPIPLEAVIGDLPKLRSEVSLRNTQADDWLGILREATRAPWFKRLDKAIQTEMRKVDAPSAAELPTAAGAEDPTDGPRYARQWYHDPKLPRICNHEARSHMASDLHRYLYAAAYAAVKDQSPRLNDFPIELLPAHSNAALAHSAGAIFNDRFKVQLRSSPATTVTSHISKDGHYFIHYDQTQCRALTVREAARVQTFPDNYFFCGNRTAQYHQVGNAVPPLLAVQLAAIVGEICSR